MEELYLHFIREDNGETTKLGEVTLCSGGEKKREDYEKGRESSQSWGKTCNCHTCLGAPSKRRPIENTSDLKRVSTQYMVRGPRIKVDKRGNRF